SLRRLCLLSRLRRLPPSTLFPYTTLFRSTGEMGIGNTTTSSAVAAVFLNKEPEVMTGRGAGLSSEGLVRKIHAIERGIAVNQPEDRKSTRLNSSHVSISYAVFCLKKKSKR